ncbi:MAG: PadR family transcriptional regulator [Burkholderiales bacterium]
MALRYAVLGLLGYSPMSGYDLNKLFGESIDHFWHASMSQIYRELNALEAEGLLTSKVCHQQDKPDRRVYNVTPEGRTEFERWLKNFPEQPLKRTRDEFSLRLFFGSSIDRRDLLTEFYRFKDQKQTNLKQIEALDRMTGDYMQKLSLFGNEEMYWRFILKKARRLLEASIDWADECIAELGEGNNENQK